jgi:hypothetical protein
MVIQMLHVPKSQNTGTHFHSSFLHRICHFQQQQQQKVTLGGKAGV